MARPSPVVRRMFQHVLGCMVLDRWRQPALPAARQGRQALLLESLEPRLLLSNDYPAALANSTPDTVDPWGFYSRECTSYVAWRMNRDSGTTAAPYAFTDTMDGGFWGNASNWDANAAALGFVVNTTPSVGAIAQWHANEGSAGSLGHVAYVESVNPDNSVNVSNYNADVTNGYSEFTITAPRYIHIPALVNHLLTTAANTVPAGAAVTFTSTLSKIIVDNGVPTGTVTFLDGTTTLGTSPVSTSGTSGVATFSTTTLSVGTHHISATYNGDANYAATGSTALIQLVGSANQRYVNQLYIDLLGRTADPGGLAAWTALLDSSADTMAQVATAFTSSREYDGNIVDGFYVKYLNRHSDPGGLNDWVNLMQGGYNAEQIRSGILGSPEYFADTGGTNASFVTALYQSFLNRSPDPGGLNDWVNLLVNHTDTTAQVATGFLNSDENRTDIITGFYERYMHRAPDPGGLAAWKTLLANGISQPAIISVFVTSPEYLAINYIS